MSNDATTQELQQEIENLRREVETLENDIDRHCRCTDFDIHGCQAGSSCPDFAGCTRILYSPCPKNHPFGPYRRNREQWDFGE